MSGARRGLNGSRNVAGTGGATTTLGGSSDSNLGQVRLTDNVKSMVCRGLKAGILVGPDIDAGKISFGLEYPCPDRELDTWLCKHGVVSVEYTHRTRGLVRRTFRFPLPQFKALVSTCKVS